MAALWQSAAERRIDRAVPGKARSIASPTMVPALFWLWFAAPPGQVGARDALASDVVAARTRAVIAWSRTHAPLQLFASTSTGAEARAGASPCVAVLAPPETGCTRAAWACPVETSAGSCSGLSSSTRGVVFAAGDAPAPSDPQGPTLILEARVGDDAPELECAAPSGFAIAGSVTAAEATRLRRAWEAEQARAYARCVEATRREQAADETRLACQVLLVNPCRREVFVRCRGRNLDRAEGLPAVGVQRFTW